ncbi:MOSC domain-containing protein [Olivibacter sp. SDN3]|uniref:MOSC domain-containing protein n=1 Tax=Olivibacter sp. SDN3 TaxID=2764720 RepID=UPI001651A069|nr:MOSC N-terminal beta barrel domain-containing protein [Olivibacter sp. SDN3]QNL50236.1 MOSC domain-containing protein [Olivibacter sp. SDN3]
MLTVSELYIYPIKSLGGITLSRAEVTDRGFKYDRRWMLVDEQNRSLTQRQYPQMSSIKMSLKSSGLLARHPMRGDIHIPFLPHNHQTIEEVTVWGDICKGVTLGSSYDQWFSETLGLKCRLIYMPDDTHRQVDTRYASKGHFTSFADGYPFLAIGQASLDDLNSRLDVQLPMNRFRPNIVFRGGEPYEEDLMKHIQVANIDFFGVKLCSRCILTTIDQQTAEKGKEPLKTLSTYRMKDNKTMFGQNLIHHGTGVMQVGDRLKVLTRHEEKRFFVSSPV